MKWRLLPLALCGCAIAGGAGAEPGAPLARDSIARVVEQAPPQNREVHADYHALSAGVILLGLGYAIALSVPVQKNFSGDSGRLAVPLLGPWLSNPSWGWALDGLVQLGGMAFMVDAYANPITVLGTPEAQLHAPAVTGEHLLQLSLRF